VARLEAQLRSLLPPLAALPLVGDVRVIGGVAAIELVADKQARAAGGYLDGVGPRLAAAFLERGILLRPLGNVLYFMPPYVISETETAWAIDLIAEVIRSEVFSRPR
jgi:adenosylmethionine-8-amino-7-oxononanoate aminotransferase